MRRGPLILLGLCVAAAAGGGGWYALHSGDALAQARTLMQQGDLRGAQLVLRDLVRSQPDLAEAHFRLGQVQLRLGDPVAAEHEFREAVAHGTDEHAARPMLAQALTGQHQAELVLREYNDTGLDAGQSADLHIARALAAAQLKQFDLARKEALAAQQAAPHSPEAALDLARVELAAGDPDAAGHAVDQALALDPHLYAALSLRARILTQQNKPAEAITAYDTAFADPSSKAVNLAGDRFAQANLYLSKGNDAAARRAVEAGLKAAPRAPLGNYLLSVLDVRAGQWRPADEALTAVGTALATFPRGDLLLATVKANLGQPQQALDAAEHYNVRHPQDQVGAKLLAEIDLILGRAPAAIRLLTPWTAANPPDADILSLLSQAYAVSGQPGNAQATLRKAVASSQANPAALTRIAAIAMREGNPVLSSDVLQAVLSADTPAPGRVDGRADGRVDGGADGSPTLVNAPDTAPAPARADTAAALVVAALRAGQVDRAAAALEALRAAHGGAEQLDLLTGAVKLAQFDLPAARTAFESARARDPASAEALANLARVMVLQGEQGAAANLLREGLAKQPADQRLVAAWIEFAGSREAAADSIPILEAAHAAAPDNTSFTVLLSGLYLQTKQPDKALALANGLPADTPLQLGLRADAQRALGNTNEAVALWQALLAKNPQDTALRQRIVGILLGDGHDAAASAMLQQGLDAHPDDAGLQAEAVALAARKDGLAAGLSRADAFAARSKTLPTLLLKGDLLMANRKFTEAAAAYAQARTVAGAKPEDAESLVLHQASALLAAGDVAGSTKLLADWQAAHPNSVAATQMLAEADIVAGRLTDARTKLEAVLASNPNNPAALNNLAWILQQQGDYEKSRPLASRAYALAPTPQAADTLGWALVKTGKAADALALLRQAAAGQPGDPTVQYHFAAALKQAGKTEDAKAVLKPALAAAGPFKDRADAEQLMQSLAGP